MKIRIATMEYRSISMRMPTMLLGKNVKSIFDPSSGGIGIKLKKARIIFIRIT